ncbi:MAG: hypothetical protein QXI58_03895, partial [Candidatus Micrarchaeia archaeon]
FKYLDYFVPCNNKGRKSLPFIFYLLAREICKIRGVEFNFKVEDFELKEEKEESEAEEKPEKEGEHEVVE